MNTRKPKGRPSGCLVFLLVIAALVVYSAVRYFADRPAADAAHAQYLKGDCTSTLPVFEELSSAFRPVDFGMLGEMTQHDELDCEAYLAAGSRNIAGYFQYAAVDHPRSPLAAFARQMAMDEISRISSITTNLGDACPLKGALLDAGWLANSDAVLPRFDYVCSTYFLGVGNTGAALPLMLELLDRYPDSTYSAWALREIGSREEICYALDKIVLYPVIMNHVDLYPQRLNECGASFVKKRDYARAVAALDSFILNYPLRPEIEEVKRLDAVALVGMAASLPTRWIRAPDASGYGETGVTRLVLQNDSPNKIRVVFVGPETLFVEMDACGGCADFHQSGPVWCPGKGPKTTFELLPGEYKVLIAPQDENGIAPSVGDWVLGEKNSFYTCYFVVK